MKIKAVLLIIIFAIGVGAQAESLTDLQAIAKELERRKIELDEKEKNMNSKEERLKALEEELLQKESALRKLKDDISARLAEIKTIEDENLDKLAKAYGSSKAKSAAAIISKMDMEKAVQLFLRMQSMTAGKVMSEMGKTDPDFAAQLSERLAPSKIQGIDGQ